MNTDLLHPPFDAAAVARALARVRELCLALPEAQERPSHGAPTFFVRGKRSFVTFHVDHHSDGRLALWCAAPDGMQRALLDTSPAHYFVPPYVGHRGWVGVRLDRGLPWPDVAAAIEDAYAAVAPAPLVAAAGIERTWGSRPSSAPPRVS